MLKPHYFTDRALRIRDNINLGSHHFNHANSKLTSYPNYPEVGIETRYLSKILKEMAILSARFINQNKLNYQTVFSARLDKQDEDNQALEEIELYINLNINHNLTGTDIDIIDIKSPLEQKVQQQEMKDSGWRFDKKNSMTL